MISLEKFQNHDFAGENHDFVRTNYDFVGKHKNFEAKSRIFEAKRTKSNLSFRKKQNKRQKSIKNP